ncbi:MAG: glycosyl hydrolase-related protein [Actinobacteria bacterium]|nr:glycosyl hydrolase-related protein [Actinomycetota bacterium]
MRQNSINLGRRDLSSKQMITIHLISHTHWDREWYQPFQVFRMRLVDLLDQLMDLMEEDEGFRYFTLDGQSVILEDYLEMRPENEGRLRKLIQDGRILIGPWYTQSDEFLASPESLIRNLLLGIKVSRRFGEPMMVGYLPDTFGHISTMPLILNGFGIDSAIFGRGRDGLKQEFLWKSPDGSQVLAVDQHYVLGTVSPPSIEGFKRVGEYLPGSGREQFKLIQSKLNQMTQRATFTDQLLLMSGIDHALPHQELPEIIRSCNEMLLRSNDSRLKNYQLIQSTLPEYIRSICAIKDDLNVETGEFRQQGHHSYTGTISSRMYLKLENYVCQQELECWAEPFSAFAWLLGREYPRSLLWKSWRELLLNHSHDSIYGCSIDSVHQDMFARFRSSRQISERITEDSLTFVAGRINTKFLEGSIGAIVIFNPLSTNRTEVVEAELDFAGDIASFGLRDEKDFDMPYQIVSCQLMDDFRFHEHGAPDFGTFARYRVALEAKDIPPCGYKTLFIVPSSQKRVSLIDEGKLSFGDSEAENEFLKLAVEKNGTLTLINKEMGSIYRNLNLFEDGADVGDEYNYSPCQSDIKILSKSFNPRICLERNGPLEVVFRVETVMEVPERVSEDRKSRSQDLAGLHIVSYISMKKGLPRLDIRTMVNNTARDHRFRVLFPIELKAVRVYVGGHFDTIERPTADEKRNGLDNTFPMRDFILVRGKGSSFVVLSQGLTEYEIIKDPIEAVAFTLFRSVGWLSRGDLLTRHGSGAYDIETPEAQCIGPQEFCYSVLPLPEDVDISFVHFNAKKYGVPLRAIKTDVHPGELPLSQGFIRITSDSLILSAIKKSEERDSITARFYNPSSHHVDSVIKLGIEATEAYRLRLDEGREEKLEVADRCIYISVKANEVVTVEVVFGKRN